MGHLVGAIADDAGIFKMLVEMIDEFDALAVFFGTDGDVVDHGEVLYIFAQANAAGMRPDREVVFSGHQLNSEDFVQSSETASVNLNDVNGVIGDELFEEDAVLAAFACRDFDRGDVFTDGTVSENVIGAGRLLDEKRACEGEGVDPGDRFVNLPDLIGINHDVCVVAEFFADDGEAPNVIVKVSSDFDFCVGKTGVTCLATEASEFVIRITEPAGRGGIAGVAVLPELCDAVGFTGFGIAQDGESFVLGESVSDVTKVDEADDFFRGHIGNELPNRFARAFSPEVPDGVDEGGGCEVDGALVRTYPAQLAVTCEMSPETPHIFLNFFEFHPLDAWPEGVDGGNANLGSASDGEGKSVSSEFAVGFKDNVSGGVVRVGIHCV